MGARRCDRSVAISDIFAVIASEEGCQNSTFGSAKNSCPSPHSISHVWLRTSGNALRKGDITMKRIYLNTTKTIMNKLLFRIALFGLVLSDRKSTRLNSSHL